MSKDMGASPSATGPVGLRPEPASGLGHAATVPSADDVLRRFDARPTILMALDVCMEVFNGLENWAAQHGRAIPAGDVISMGDVLRRMKVAQSTVLRAVPRNNEAVLTLEWRPDGGLRVHSPTHLGMVLSHPQPDKVMLDVLPVLAELGFRPPASGMEARQGQDAAGGLIGEADDSAARSEAKGDAR